MLKRFATIRSCDNMFHAQVFATAQRLISFRSVISESDNLFVSRWAQNKSSFSRHFTTFVLGLHLCELTLVFFSNSMEK